MAFSDPQSVLENLGVSEGSVIADLGSGSGFYTMAAARLTGPGGKVFAVDVQAELLARVKNAARQAKIHNVEIVHGDIEKVGGTRLRERTIDIVLLCNTLFQVEHKDGLVTEIKRITKTNGRVLIVDWQESFGGMGPQPEHVITEENAKKLFEKQGFAFVNTIEAGDHHYGLVFRKT